MVSTNRTGNYTQNSTDFREALEPHQGSSESRKVPEQLFAKSRLVSLESSDCLVREKDLQDPHLGSRLRGGHFLIKEPGSVLNPLNWRQQLVSGERSISFRPLILQGHAGGLAGPVIDGPDEILSALQGTRIPRYVLEIFQCTLVYPLFLIFTKMAYNGAVGEHEEAHEEYEKLGARIDALRTKILERWQDEGRLAYNGLNNPQLTDEEFFHLLCKHLGYLSPDKDLADLKLWYDCLRLLAAFSSGLEQLPLRSSQYSQTSNLAIYATGMMLLAIVFYELYALLVVGGVLAYALMALEIGEVLLPLSQVIMAFYALASSRDGYKEHRLLTKEIARVRADQTLSAEGQQTLLARLSRKRALNFKEGILGGSLLLVGQLTILAGGVALGLGLPVLLLGAGITIGAILVRIRAEGQKEHEGFLARDLQERQEEQFQEAWKDSLQPQTPYTAFPTLLAKLEGLGKTPQLQLLWLTLWQELEQAQEPRAVLADPKFQVLLGKLEVAGFRVRDYVEQNIANPRARELPLQLLMFLKGYLLLDAEAAADFGLEEQALNRLLSRSPAEWLTEFEGPGLREEELYNLLSEVLEHYELTSAVKRRLLERLVIEQKARDNLRGARYEKYLDKVKVYQPVIFSLPLVGPEVTLWHKEKTAYALRLFDDDFQPEFREPAERELFGSLLEISKQVLAESLVEQTTMRQRAIQDEILNALRARTEWSVISYLASRQQVAGEEASVQTPLVPSAAVGV